MTGTDIIKMAETLVDETIDSVIGLQIVNSKIAEIEAQYEFSYLHDENSSE